MYLNWRPEQLSLSDNTSSTEIFICIVSTSCQVTARETPDS